MEPNCAVLVLEFRVCQQGAAGVTACAAMMATQRNATQLNGGE